MRIAFLHAGLELGVDGVADYARTLALELTRRGHACIMVGLHDRVEKITQTDYGTEGEPLPALRLPLDTPWGERVLEAQRFLAEFQPDWCSLQFVAYGFNRRGLVHGLAPHLTAMIGRTPLHLMFHELWIGQTRMASVKSRLIGSLQSLLIRRLVAQIAPRVIHTSNPTYARALERKNLHSRCLPLFGNIPVGLENGDDWLLPELRVAGADITSADRGRWWLFGFFGTLHTVWPPEPLLTRIDAAARAANRKVAFISIGGLGPGAKFWDKLTSEHNGRFAWLRLGRRPGVIVSQFLNSLDFAIATSPLSLIGKSGSVAAMLEHDVPVIVNREDSIKDGLDAQPLEGYGRFIRLDEKFAARLAAPPARQPGSRLPIVAGQFLEALGETVTASRAATISR